MSVIRYDPFREYERLTEHLLGRGSHAGGALGFPMDAYRRGETFHVELDLPGFEPASIDVTVEQNVLTVRAERRFEPEEADEIVVSERPQGTFQRQLQLSESLDSDRLSAHYVNGVLRLAIPVAERAKPRRIEVKHEHAEAGGRPQTIEAESRSADK